MHQGEKGRIMGADVMCKKMEIIWLSGRKCVLLHPLPK